MLISRRVSLAYASALTAVSATPAAAMVNGLNGAFSTQAQRIQHLMIHPDEAGGRMICANLSLPAPDTAWETANMLNDAALQYASTAWRQRGYGLRRLNAFRTQQGTRYAAIWQLGLPAPGHVETAMDAATFGATTARLALQGFAISQIDAARTDAGVQFTAIWERGFETQHVLTDLTDADFAQQVAARAAEGLVPRLVAGYASGAGARFAAVFSRAKAGRPQVDLALAVSDQAAHTRAMQAAGFQLRDASGYVVSGQPFITAVWEKA